MTKINLDEVLDISVTRLKNLHTGIEKYVFNFYIDGNADDELVKSYENLLRFSAINSKHFKNLMERNNLLRQEGESLHLSHNSVNKTLFEKHNALKEKYRKRPMSELPITLDHLKPQYAWVSFGKYNLVHCYAAMHKWNNLDKLKLAFFDHEEDFVADFDSAQWWMPADTFDGGVSE